jgi:hypothetical protein
LSDSEDEVKGAFLLYVVVSEGSGVLKRLATKDETLLAWRDPLFVFELGLDNFDCVFIFTIEGESLSGKGLDEDLHSTSELKDEVKGGFLLDVVVT